MVAEHGLETPLLRRKTEGVLEDDPLPKTQSSCNRLMMSSTRLRNLLQTSSDWTTVTS